MQVSLLATAMNAMSMLLIPVGVGGAGFVLLNEVSARARRRARLSDDGQPGAPGSGAPPELGVLATAAEGVKRIGARIAIQDPSQISALRNRLVQAGFFSREAVTLYLGARAVALALATGATLLVLPWAIAGGGGMGATLTAALFATVALLGPDQVLKARITARAREYRDGFPDLLDLLVASVEAGLSLDAAVSRITVELTRRYPNLATHLQLLALELRAGRSRKEVWSQLADRLGIDEARSFATMLRQSEELGTSLGDTLKVFADEMRTKRMLRAEAKALALPAKLVVPLILFIFPCLLGVLMLPAAFKISQVFGNH